MAAPKDSLSLSDADVILLQAKQLQGLEKGLVKPEERFAFPPGHVQGLTYSGHPLFSEGTQSLTLTLTCIFLLLRMKVGIYNANGSR